MPDEAYGALIAIGFLTLGLLIIPWNGFLERRRAAREARERNQARPWRDI